ncbi:MAG: hypothetical protein Q7V40_09650, partial [Pseudolabrys sp.]|nr:hypothetical protein [Pseudolabrys sp.]
DALEPRPPAAIPDGLGRQPQKIALPPAESGMSGRSLKPAPPPDGSMGGLQPLTLADALDPPAESNGGRHPVATDRAAAVRPPELDALSAQNVFAQPTKTESTLPSGEGQYPQYANIIKQIGAEKGWQSFNPATVGQLLKGESGGRNMPPNKYGYTGYFQMRPNEFTKDGQFLPNARNYGGPRMTPQDFANMSFAEQAQLYANRLEKLGYDGTQNLGVMNAAPAFKNAADDTVAYPAGSRAAAANPAWVRNSDAGGAVTVAGIKRWHEGSGGTSVPNPQQPAEWQTAGLGGMQGGIPFNDAQPSDVQPYQVASLGGMAPPAPRPPMNSIPESRGLGLSEQQAQAQAAPPQRVAQSSGVLDWRDVGGKQPLTGGAPLQMQPPQGQSQAQSQAQGYVNRSAEAAQRQMQILQQAWRTAPNAELKKYYAQEFYGAQQAYTKATTPTEETVIKDGWVLTVRTDPTTGQTSVINRTPQVMRDEKRTPAQRQYHEEYLPSVAAGQTPVDFTTWERDNKRSGAITGDTQDAKNRSDMQFAHFKTAIANADTAGQFNSDLKTYMDLQRDLQAGPLTRQVYDKYGTLLQSIGIGEGEIGKVQGMASIAARLGPKMRAAGSGATSDWEGQQFLKGLPALANTNEGNAIISSVLTNMNDIAQKRAMLAAQQSSGSTGMSFADYLRADQEIVKNADPLKAWRDWARGSGNYQENPVTMYEEEMRRRGLK